MRSKLTRALPEGLSRVRGARGERRTLRDRTLPSTAFITLCGYDNLGQREQLTKELTQRAGRPPKAVSELRICDLWPPEKRKNVRLISPYRIRNGEIERYDGAIEDFLKAAGIRALLEERTCHR